MRLNRLNKYVLSVGAVLVGFEGAYHQLETFKVRV